MVLDLKAEDLFTANSGHYSEYRQGSGSNYFTTEPHNDLIVEDAFFAFDAGGY